MNDFFDLDAPLFRFLTRVADMVILSLLWLIGSLPLFTLGISSTALYYAVNKSLIENRGTVSEEFFRAYRRSFRQATLSFLALAVPESILLADCFMTHYLKGQQAATGNPWIIFTVLSTCGLAWMIYNAAYAARFDDPVKKTVLQSGAMALLHFDKSLLLLVVLAAFGLLTAFCPPLILLALPDQKSETGLRDMVLLSFMYATGTRAQEVCDLTVKSVNFRSTGTTIDIVGKGSKARRIRIPDPCASMLRKYIRHRRIETEPDRHIFSSQTHEHMTISCVEEIYKKYIKLAKEKTPNLFKEEHYSPHSMRHTTGQHMLEAGVPIMVIKAFLGHASVQTTQIYTESPQATVDKHIREWNEMNFPRSIYIDEEDLEERNVPDFLKSH